MASKGGTVCICRGCSSKMGQGISFFIIPKNRTRAETWLKACHRTDLLCKNVNLQNYRLCEMHFEEKYVSKGGTRKTLFAQAVPTIFSYGSKQSYIEGCRFEELPKKGTILSDVSTAGQEIPSYPSSADMNVPCDDSLREMNNEVPFAEVNINTDQLKMEEVYIKPEVFDQDYVEFEGSEEPSSSRPEQLEPLKSSTVSADEVPGLNAAGPSSKRLKKRHFSMEMKEAVLKIYKSESLKDPDMHVYNIIERVAHQTEISVSSVQNIIKEYKTTGTLSGPKPVQNRRTLLSTLCSSEKTAIRRKFHDLFIKKRSLTVITLMNSVNEDPNLPDFKKSTFLKLLKELKLRFLRRQGISLILDRDEVRCWRREYLTTIKRYRNENRKIYYLAETWVSAVHTKSVVDRQPFSKGSSLGSKKSTGEAKGLIICHIGSEDGFHPGALCSFESEKSKDHPEADGPSFEEWFSSILPRLEANSVIVLDNSPCHSRKIEKIPTKASKKCDVQEWLRSKNIPFDNTMLKPQLLRLLNANKKQYDKYIVDEMAEAENKIVLRLPPDHGDLNPMEFIWTEVKRFVGGKNATFEFTDVQNIFHQAILHITPGKWREYVQHVQQEVELKMWQIDEIMEEVIESLVTNLDGDSGTSSDTDPE